MKEGKGKNMRIISGKHRGRKLVTLEGLDVTRPTSDRVKEALFNIIGNRVIDANVLDMFAGSGALGLEAISRGAKQCVFIDSSKNAINVIKNNIALCKEEQAAQVINLDYKLALDKVKNIKFDLVFIDPPYLKDIEESALLGVSNLLNKDAIVIVETDQTDDLPETVSNLVKYDARKYGRTIISFYCISIINN